MKSWKLFEIVGAGSSLAHLFIFIVAFLEVVKIKTFDWYTFMILVSITAGLTMVTAAFCYSSRASMVHECREKNKGTTFFTSLMWLGLAFAVVSYQMKTHDDYITYGDDHRYSSTFAANELPIHSLSLSERWTLYWASFFASTISMIFGYKWITFNIPSSKRDSP